MDCHHTPLIRILKDAMDAAIAECKSQRPQAHPPPIPPQAQPLQPPQEQAQPPQQPSHEEALKLESLKKLLASYTNIRTAHENQDSINLDAYSEVMNNCRKLSYDIWAIEDKLAQTGPPKCAPPGFDHTTVFYSQPTGQDLSYRKTMRLVMI
jgi:hypothetical protein